MAVEASPVLVVFGAGGQLGRALVEAGPPPGWTLAAFDHGAADITDAPAVEDALSGISRGVVVNAAAYTAVDRAESEPEAALALNRDGAALLARAADRHGLALIFPSTDYVFAGDQDHPYIETDVTGPLSIYGASKLAGEAAVRAALARHVILRISWLFSAHGANFVRTIVRLAGERERLSVVDDQIGCPTAAEDVAAVIRELAPRLLDAAPNSEAFGTFHCCGDEAVSWHGFAAAILDGLRQRGRKVATLENITTLGYPLPARRPAYSVMSCERLRAVHAIHPPSWRPALARCLDRLGGES